MSMRHNTGINSSNEIFAMKKNLGYESKFEYQMQTMTRDFFHRRKNFNQEIRNVYAELKSIKTSTGYSRDTVRSGGTQRTANVPRIYLPPIGIRLVKKYVGLDFKRMSLAGDSKEQRRLSMALNSTFNLNKPRSSVPNDEDDVARRYSNFMADPLDPIAIDETDEAEQEVNDSNYVDKGIVKGQPKIKPQNILVIDDTVANTDDVALRDSTKACDGSDDTKVQEKDPLPPIRREKHIDDTGLDGRDTKMTDKIICEVENANSDSKQDYDPNDKSDKNNDAESTKTLLVDDREIPFERRSSRSTIRIRSPANQRMALSEYNLKVVGLTKSGIGKGKTKVSKEKLGSFYLDYGDGKLHDHREIPKMKDCARAWCSPHCKTCRLRTTDRPCFVFVPVDDIGRKRKVKVDEKVSKLLEAFRKSSDSDLNLDEINEKKETAKDNSNVLKDSSDKTTDPHASDRAWKRKRSMMGQTMRQRVYLKQK